MITLLLSISKYTINLLGCQGNFNRRGKETTDYTEKKERLRKRRINHKGHREGTKGKEKEKERGVKKTRGCNLLLQSGGMGLGEEERF